MRPYKRFVMFGALAAVVFAASAATSEAQVRGHVRGRTTVVVGGGFYSPYYYDPFFFADPWYGGYQYPIAPYGYGYRYAEPDASIRLDATNVFAAASSDSASTSRSWTGTSAGLSRSDWTSAAAARSP